MSSELEAIIADQMAVIDDLNERLAKERHNPYWEGVYDDIREAFEKFAMVELRTARPGHLDLAGRPELERLWETIK